jgi:hypothetical protein
VPRIQIDLRFVEIEYELWALGQFLTFLEPQIKSLGRQDRAKTVRELKRQGWDHDETEISLAFQDLTERQEYVIPRFMRGPFIVSLWACFESSVSEIADHHKKRLHARLGLRDVRADNPLKRGRLYFDTVLRIPLERDNSRYNRLNDLLLVRNALAHANGQQRAMSPAAWKKLRLALARRKTPVNEYRGFVVLSAAFVGQAFSDVNDSLLDLVRRSRA